MTFGFHKHHIAPKHAGGTNEPQNLVMLTIPEHAEAHRLLYEQYGRIQDKVAWFALAGRIPEMEEAYKELQGTYGRSCRGIKRPAEHIASARAGLIGKPKTAQHAQNISIGKTGKKRLPFSAEWKANIGKASLGRLVSNEMKAKISKANTGRRTFGRLVSIETRMKIGAAVRQAALNRKKHNDIN